MKRVAALLLAVFLGGCFENQKQKAAACELEAQRTYPAERLELSNQMGNYIKLCMAAAGYAWSMAHKKCQPAFTAQRNAYCYVPTGAVAGAFYRLEMILDP